MNNKKYVSINYKLVMFLFVLLALILGVGLLINKLFYYDYYLNSEKETIYEFAQDLDHYYENNIEVEDFIEEFLLTKKANLYIYGPSDLENPQNIYQDNITNASPGKAYNMQKYNSLPENVLEKTINLIRVNSNKVGGGEPDFEQDLKELSNLLYEKKDHHLPF
jgi:hypothetical protein